MFYLGCKMMNSFFCSDNEHTKILMEYGNVVFYSHLCTEK